MGFLRFYFLFRFTAMTLFNSDSSAEQLTKEEQNEGGVNLA